MGRAGVFLVAAAGAAWFATSPAGTAPLRRPGPVPAPAAPATVDASGLGLILYGVSGGGTEAAAIIGSESGGQRLVRTGRDFRPGLRLIEVGADHAVLMTGGRPARLELRRFGDPYAKAVPGRGDAERAQGIEAAVLRQILKPVVSNGRIGGYALRGGESLPQLEQAGLRPGDVILSVNGSQLDEERMGELAWEMRNASKIEFVFMRDGRKMRANP